MNLTKNSLFRLLIVVAIPLSTMVSSCTEKDLEEVIPPKDQLKLPPNRINK